MTGTLVDGTIVMSSEGVTGDASVDEAGGSVSYGTLVTGGVIDTHGAP
jgi:hypothetical protein